MKQSQETDIHDLAGFEPAIPTTEPPEISCLRIRAHRDRLISHDETNYKNTMGIYFTNLYQISDLKRMEIEIAQDTEFECCKTLRNSI